MPSRATVLEFAKKLFDDVLLTVLLYLLDLLIGQRLKLTILVARGLLLPLGDLLSKLDTRV